MDFKIPMNIFTISEVLFDSFSHLFGHFNVSCFLAVSLAHLLCSVSGYQGFCESDSTLFPASFWLSSFLVCLGFSFTMRGPRLRREPEATRTHVSPRRDPGSLGCHCSHKQRPQTPGPTAATASPERFLFVHPAPASRRGAGLFPPRGAKRGLSGGGASSWVPSRRVGSAPGAAGSRGRWALHCPVHSFAPVGLSPRARQGHVANMG